MSDFLIGWIILLPPILGALAWGARPAGWRRAVVVAAAAAIALSGLWLAWGGPFTASFGRPVALAGHLLEFVLTAAVFEISRRRRVWSALVLSGAQLALTAYQHAWLGAWRRVESCVFALDGLSLALVLISTIIGSAIVLFAVGYMGRHERHAPATAASTGRFFFFLIGFLGLMNGLVLAGDLAWLSVFWESTTLCSVFLIGHDRTPEAVRNANRALALNSVGGLALAAASALAFARLGGDDLALLLRQAPLLPIAFLALAALTKSAQLPFQSWLLGAMVAPTPVSALLHSSTMVKAGSYLILRLAPAFETTVLAPMLAVAGAFTFAAASALAVGQGNAKKVLAYSTIANLGLIVACAGLNTPLAYAAALMTLVFHAVSKSLLFLCVGTIEQRIGSREIEDMSGIWFTMPLTATVAMIGMFSMVVPPFGMLLTKWMAIEAAAHAPLVLLLVIAGSALTVFFWLKWLGRIITSSYHESYAVEQAPRGMTATLLFLAALVVASMFGALPLYHLWARPLAVGLFARLDIPDRSWDVLRSVDGFLDWPILVVLAAVLALAAVSAAHIRRSQVRLPFLCGENAPQAKDFEFRSVMDRREEARSAAYYLSPVFGERAIGVWANPVALLIILSLFARAGML